MTYEQVILFDREAKTIGHTGLFRGDYGDGPHEGEQKVLIKRKEIFFCEGFHFNLGNKVVQVGKAVEEKDFISGNFFLQDPKEREKAQLRAAAPKPTYKLCVLPHSQLFLSVRVAAANRDTKGFKVPYKGSTSNARRNVKPLHNPYAPGALVLYEPKTNLFGEK